MMMMMTIIIIIVIITIIITIISDPDSHLKHGDHSPNVCPVTSRIVHCPNGRRSSVTVRYLC